MNAEERKAVPQFPLPPKVLYLPFSDPSYHQDPPEPPQDGVEYFVFGVSRKRSNNWLSSIGSCVHSVSLQSDERKTSAIRKFVLHVLQRYDKILELLCCKDPEWSLIQEELIVVEEHFMAIYQLVNLLRVDQAKIRVLKLWNSQVVQKEQLAHKLEESQTHALTLLQNGTGQLMTIHRQNSKVQESRYSNISVQSSKWQQKGESTRVLSQTMNILKTIESIMNSRNEDKNE